MFANPISFTLMFVFECMCVVFRWRLNSINETHSHAHKRASTTRVHSYALIMKTIIIGWREEKTPPGKNVAAAVCSARPQSAFAICRSIPSSSSLFSFLWHFQFTLWNVRTIIQCARYRIMFFGENTQYTIHNTQLRSRYHSWNSRLLCCASECVCVAGKTYFSSFE